MDTILTMAVLAVVTVAALFTALGLNWLLLRSAFALMQPATANRRVVVPIEKGTRMVARAYAQAVR